MKIGHLMKSLDIGIERHNYKLALTEVLDISQIYPSCNSTETTITLFVSTIIEFNIQQRNALHRHLTHFHETLLYSTASIYTMHNKANGSNAGPNC